MLKISSLFVFVKRVITLNISKSHNEARKTLARDAKSALD